MTSLTFSVAAQSLLAQLPSRSVVSLSTEGDRRSTFVFVFTGVTLSLLSLWPVLALHDVDVKLRLLESKSTNENSRDQPVVPVISSTTTSNAESTSSTPKFREELKLASQFRKFTFNDLKLATRNFRPEILLGEGGFGCVFKGWFEENGTAPLKPGTGLTVAVKTLNHDGLQGHKVWLAEVNFLGNLLHPNLVKLIGYCIEDDQRLLVYEFMPRGSLENHLFPST